ncbi:MAG: tRNA 4-thiouridine(8) synthase ThiI [Lentisphaeria bacterium]|nr:tRNA 4-thiouridine(8) synthase ThiI [Lentisphaeria bacterium]
MYNAVLCRYHEIAIKGNNRHMFERCLMDNIHVLLKKDGIDFDVKRVRGRVWIEKRDLSDFTENELAFVKKALSRTFGLESFSPAVKIKSEMSVIEAKVAELTPLILADYFAKKEVVKFRIRARRSDKEFPLCSKDIEIALAKVVADNCDSSRLKVDLDHAELTFGCEVRDEFSILFFEECKSPGGLPVGCNGKALALLSGGIDSPVACYMTMKRGCPVEYLSFHSTPYTPIETTDKIKTIAAFLNTYQRGGRLFLCNLVEFQKAVRDFCQPRYRTILYRRGMLRIGEAIAAKYGHLALLTGDSVGQVASQTIENMSTIDRATNMLVLRPLVGMDKNEAIRIATAIGSMELSSVQVPDSCTVFSPSQAATHSTVELIEAEEQKIANYSEIIAEIAENAEIFQL